MYDFLWKKTVAMCSASVGMEQLVLRSRASSMMNCAFSQARCCCRGRVRPNSPFVFLARSLSGMYEFIGSCYYKAGAQSGFMGGDIKESYMLDRLLEHCKEQKNGFAAARFAAVEEREGQSGDFMVVGWMLEELAKGRRVTFVAFRQNYAHFLSLSKKLGKSIEGYLKSKQLTYIQCFQSHFSSQLPLVQSPPATYVSPPSLIRKIYTKDLMKEKDIFAGAEVVFIDAIGYVDSYELWVWLFEQAMANECRLVMGGLPQTGEFTQSFELAAELIVRLQNDVGGYGKLSVMGMGKKSSVLWKTINGQLQFSQQIAI